jgi:hypothetical protein
VPSGTAQIPSPAPLGLPLKEDGLDADLKVRSTEIHQSNFKPRHYHLVVERPLNLVRKSRALLARGSVACLQRRVLTLPRVSHQQLAAARQEARQHGGDPLQ